MLKTQAASTIVIRRPRLYFSAPHAANSRNTSSAYASSPSESEDPEHILMADQESDSNSKQPRMSLAHLFPQSFGESAKQWWACTNPKLAERRLLDMVPYLKEATADNLTAPPNSDDPFGFRVWRSEMVELSGKNRALNEYSVERVGEKVDENLVMLHGYGAGLGFFYRNYEPLTRAPGWKLYALDMLGMGNSTRPPFSVKAKTREAQITEAENWFIDSLEEWRTKRKLDNFTLCAHSLGGYLGVAYALKYPGRIKKLILASPVGVPADPHAISAEMPEPEESAMQNEFTRDQESIVHGKNATGPADAPKRRVPGWLSYLWDANVSPFSIVRLTGPLGPRIVSGWSSRRFNHLPQNDASLLHDYAFSIFRQSGSGEYAMPYLLAPGAFARSPLISRIDGVGRQVLPAPMGSSAAGVPLRETGIPIVMMYGDGDWMDAAGGFAAEQKLLKAREKTLLTGTDYEKKNENGAAKVVIIQDAGHHLFIDNPEEFNKHMRAEMDETRAEGLRKKATASQSEA
ncbi:putative cardiolipin-specific deacylase mitochondrial [Ceratocystis platani]|uniref:Putative cardiolipin-specific deacylase mitochondrial n=1 Tax=Ceratocystis fimbriata f. sp. platani TaxID=88771 RepID=A0A0F8D4K6_CERFI|nr:putative cardiolipin-specific deacylase mitochondrial [Ceratocystis platani]